MFGDLALSLLCRIFFLSFLVSFAIFEVAIFLEVSADVNHVNVNGALALLASLFSLKIEF